MEIAGVGDVVAELLYQNGFKSAEDVAQADEQSIADVEGVGPDRAANVLKAAVELVEIKRIKAEEDAVKAAEEAAKAAELAAEEAAAAAAAPPPLPAEGEAETVAEGEAVAAATGEAPAEDSTPAVAEDESAPVEEGKAS
jgi:NAD-dependent DNA ligase